MRHTLQGHDDWVLVAEFSPDGRWLATAGMDTGPLIWDVATGALRRTLEGHTSGVYGVALSSDGSAKGLILMRSNTAAVRD